MNQSVFPCRDVRTDRATLIGKPDSSSSVKAKAVSDIRDYKSSFSPASCSAERLLMIQFKSTSWNSRRRVGIKRKSAWNLEIPENNHWTHKGCSQHFSFCKILYCRGQPWCLGVYSKVTRGKPFFPCTALLHLYNPVLFARLCQHSNYKGPALVHPWPEGKAMKEENVLILSLCLLAGSVYRHQMPCPLIVLYYTANYFIMSL